MAPDAAKTELKARTMQEINNENKRSSLLGVDVNLLGAGSSFDRLMSLSMESEDNLARELFKELPDELS